MKKVFLYCSILSVFLCFSSCATVPGDHEAAVKSAREGKYEKSLDFIEKKKSKIYGKKSEVLYHLDTGLLQHYNNDWQASITNLSAAEQDIYDLYTKSITAEIGTYILNDTVRDYAGEDYEDIYLNVFNSLNYYHQGKIDDAIVETNRAINKITALSNKYQQELIKARQAAKVEAEKAGADKGAASKIETAEIKSISFHDSALAEYLRMLYCRSIGDYDGASTNQRMIKDAFITQKALYNFPVPESIDEELKVPRDEARLNVVAFSGISPIKDEIIIRDYGLADFSFALALPKLEKMPYPFSRIVVRAENVETGKTVVQAMDIIESLENVAEETFELHHDVIYAKAIARSVTKAVASNVGMSVGEQLSTSSDDGVAAVGILMQLASIAGNVTNQVTEHADLRISRYFPAKASVSGITLEPGMYDIQIDYYGQGNKILHSDVHENVNLKAGKLNLVESVCLGN